MIGMRSIGRWLGAIAGVVLVWLAACALIGVRAGEAAMHPNRLKLTPEMMARAQALAAETHAKLEPVSLKAADGAELRAWLIQPQAANGDAVMLLHGQGDNRAGMLTWAGFLLKAGYATLLPDARADGESGGPVATFGVLEAADIAGWTRWLRARLHPDCVDALGASMGAGELLVSLGSQPQLCAVVADSPYASFREASYDRIGQYVGAGPWLGQTLLRPVVPIGFAWARWRYGVDLEQAAPRRALARTSLPVLLIHGLEDDNLPPRHSRMLAASNPSATVWWVPEAGHCGAITANREEYERRVLGWFQVHRSAR